MARRWNPSAHPRDARGRFRRKGADLAIRAGSAVVRYGAPRAASAARRAVTRRVLTSAGGRLAIEGGLPSVVPGQVIGTTVKASAPLLALTPTTVAVGVGVAAVAGATAYGVYRYRKHRATAQPTRNIQGRRVKR